MGNPPPADLRIVFVMTDDAPQGSLYVARRLVHRLGSAAGIVTCGQQPLGPDCVRLAPAELGQALADVPVVVDDGGGRLGGPTLPFSRPFVQVVRGTGDSVGEAVAQPHEGGRVFASWSLMDELRTHLRPDDLLLQDGVPVLPGLPEKDPFLTVLHGPLGPDRCLDQVLARRPVCGQVVVIGEGDERAALAAKHPDVVFLGDVDPQPWLQRAAVAIDWADRPRHGFRHSACEALGCGCAVIANRAGDLRSLASGRLVEYPDGFYRLGEAWQRLFDQRSKLATLQRSSLALARFALDAEVALTRWEWLLRERANLPDDRPTLLVGVVYDHFARQQLDFCLQSLARQTSAARVVVLHDRSLEHDPEVASWLATAHPTAQYAGIHYYGAAGECRAKVRNRLLELRADEPILVWIDADVVLPRQALEQTAAVLTVEPHGVVIFPRQRLRMPARLPKILLETVLHYGYRQLDDPQWHLRRNRRALADRYIGGDQGVEAELASGPVRALRAEYAFTEEERYYGVAPDDLEWSLRAIVEKHLIPRLGPEVFQLVAGPDDCGCGKRDPAATTRWHRRRRQLRSRA